jgi:hypothetical protein
VMTVLAFVGLAIWWKDILTVAGISVT